MSRVEWSDIVLNKQGRLAANVPVTIGVHPGEPGVNTLFANKTGVSTKTVKTNSYGYYSVFLEPGVYDIHPEGAEPKIISINSGGASVTTGELAEERVKREEAVAAEEARAKAVEKELGSTAAPAITNPGPQAGVVGTPTELKPAATNNPTNYTAVGLPTGLNFNTTTGRVSGTPSAIGNFKTTITATNAVGSSSTEFNWVISAAVAPKLTKPADQTGTVGAAVNLQLEASNATEYSFAGQPKGLSINSGTGKITGTPTTAEGPLTVTLTVKGPGGEESITIKWIIGAEVVEPFIRPGESKVESTGTTQKAPAPPEGTVVGDLLLMPIQLETNTVTLTAGTIAALVAEGWTQIGTLGNIAARNFYLFARTYTGSAMPTLTASGSTTWDVRGVAIAGGASVNVNSGWNNQASSVTVNIASVTTPEPNELVVAITCKPAATSETTPAGFVQFNTKNQFRIFDKTQVAAGASGATTATLGVAEASTAITLGILKTAAVASITTKVSADLKSVEPVTLPPGTTQINAAYCTAESGQDENTIYETVASSVTKFFGTVARPWVALKALNASGEALGTFSVRRKTTPEALAPVVAKPPTQNGNVSKPLSFQITATESPTSYTAAPLPAGLALNAGTGVISGTPTTMGTTTVKVTATNAIGVSATVEFSWVIGAAVTSTFTSGLVLNSDTTSSPTVAGIALGPAAIVRAEFGIATAASTIREKAEFFAAKGAHLQPLAGFNSRIPSAAEAKGLKAWAEALVAFDPTKEWILEFGNETNYPNQLGVSKANGESYGVRAKEAAESLVGTGVKLIVQGSDAGSSNTAWLDGIFVVWPGVASHAQFAGWSIHAYPGSHVEGETDTFGKPMMERMVKRLNEKGDTTSKFYDSEWGVPCTASGLTMTSGQSMNWSEGAKVLEKHIPILEVASEHRMTQLLLYQAHDQKPDTGTDTEREHFFGALQSEGGSKGAFTTFAKAFL